MNHGYSEHEKKIVENMVAEENAFRANPDQKPLSTDREQAVSCLLGLIDALEKHEGDLARLEHVVGKAQNDPPLGFSDGSLSGREWEAARDAAKLLRQGLAAARRLAP